jgi:hypothetical protein
LTKSTLLFCLFSQAQNAHKPLTLCAHCAIIFTKGGADMAQNNERIKKSTNLTLAPEIKKKGLMDADNLGMSFSAYVSMLIANYKKKG